MTRRGSTMRVVLLPSTRQDNTSPATAIREKNKEITVEVQDSAMHKPSVSFQETDENMLEKHDSTSTENGFAANRNVHLPCSRVLIKPKV